MNPVIRVAIERPRLVVAVWVLLTALSVPLMMNLPGALKAGGFENPRGESAMGQPVGDRAFREPAQSLQIVLHDPDGDVTPAVTGLATSAASFPKVVSVTDHRAEPDWLSADRRTAFVQLGYQADPTTVQSLITDLRERARAAVSGRGVEVNVTGTQALDHDLSVQSESDAATAELIAFPLLVIVLLLVFRSVAAMLVPIVVAGMALVLAMAGGYLLTRLTDISILFTNAVSIIGLAVAVDYSLFIVKRYRDELAEGAEHVPALWIAMRTAGHAVLFSGLAVVVALLALFIPRMMVFTSIALAGITVTLIALAMSMTLLPAVLRLLGRRIDWISIKARHPRRPAREVGFLTRLHGRPLPVVLVLAAVFTLLAWPMSGIRLQAPVASATILPADADSRRGIERLQADLDARTLFPLQVVMSAPRSAGTAPLLDSVAGVARLAETRPEIHSVQALTGLGLPDPALRAAASGDLTPLPEQARAAFVRLWAEDGPRYVSRVVVVPTGGPDSDVAHDLVRELRDRLPSVVTSEVSVWVTGATAHGVDFDDVLLQSMPAILGVVALITLALLTRAFGSWRLPLLALVLNAMVVAASLGLLTLISQRALGQRIDSTTPALVFAIMFGLSMDYMVIMITRMRESFLEHRDHHRAVTEGLRHTTGLVNGAALIMIAVFVSFLAAQISLVQQLGLGLAIAVALDAVVIRLLVMPAALHLLGPKVWGRAGAQTSTPAGHPAEVDRRAKSVT